jgi:hypothetical protein
MGVSLDTCGRLCVLWCSYSSDGWC